MLNFVNIVSKDSFKITRNPVNMYTTTIQLSRLHGFIVIINYLSIYPMHSGKIQFASVNTPFESIIISPTYHDHRSHCRNPRH